MGGGTSSYHSELHVMWLCQPITSGPLLWQCMKAVATWFKFLTLSYFITVFYWPCHFDLFVPVFLFPASTYHATMREDDKRERTSYMSLAQAASSGIMQASHKDTGSQFLLWASHTPDMMALFLDISSWLEATEHYIQAKKKVEHLAVGASISFVSPEEKPQWRDPPMTSHAAKKWVEHGKGQKEQSTAAVEDELYDEVWERVAHRLRWSPIIDITSIEEDCDSDPAMRSPPKKRKVLKSGKVHTADTRVLMSSCTQPQASWQCTTNSSLLSSSAAIWQAWRPSSLP